MKHHVVSASGSKIWMNCTPSARLQEAIKKQRGEKSSFYADEGRLAHSIIEQMLKRRIGDISDSTYREQMLILCADQLYKPEMFDYCQYFVLKVLEVYSEVLKERGVAFIHIEVKLDLDPWIKGGFGTSDVCICAPGIIVVIDMKYGAGVPISAVENTQQMIYALGAYEEFNYIFGFKEARLYIIQPRRDNDSQYNISTDDLLHWAENVLMPKAELAYEGAGDFVPGDHCQFCRARTTCRALEQANSMLAKYDFSDPDLLDVEEVAEVVKAADRFTAWINAVKAYALDEALKGVELPGLKVVRGTPRRKINDTAALIQGFKDHKLDLKQLIKPTAPKGITELNSILGSQLFVKLVEPLIVNPLGKPTLVPTSDKRRAINDLEAIRADFDDLENEEDF